MFLVGCKDTNKLAENQIIIEIFRIVPKAELKDSDKSWKANHSLTKKVLALSQRQDLSY